MVVVVVAQRTDNERDTCVRENDIFRYILGTRGEYPADLDVVRNANT